MKARLLFEDWLDFEDRPMPLVVNADINLDPVFERDIRNAWEQKGFMPQFRLVPMDEPDPRIGKLLRYLADRECLCSWMENGKCNTCIAREILGKEKMR